MEDKIKAFLEKGGQIKQAPAGDAWGAKVKSHRISGGRDFEKDKKIEAHWKKMGYLE